LQSNGVSSITGTCATQFYTVLDNILTAQTLLSNASAIPKDTSSRIISNSETSFFQISSLLARSLIASESQDVNSTTSVARLSRQSASIASNQSVTLSGNTLSVTMPRFAGKQFGTEQVAATDLLTSVISLSNKLPTLPGIDPLSPGITISVSKGNAKAPLDVAGLPKSDSVKFTVPLTRSPLPSPAPGKLFRCKSCVCVVKSCAYVVTLMMQELL
jgi:hypothetical protein